MGANLFLVLEERDAETDRKRQARVAARQKEAFNYIFINEKLAA